MDYQTTLDKVYNGIFVQGGPSVNEAGFCKYRGVNGRKCAAGQLIEDKWYYPDLEGKIVGGSSEIDMALENSGYTDFEFIRKLQICHDRPVLASKIVPIADQEFIQIFHENISALALEYELTPPIRP